jgi:hypothetical protein
MRSAAIGFGAAFALGIAALVLVGLGQRSSLVYSLGVNPARVAAELQPGDRACQAPVRAPSGVAFDRVGFRLIASGAPGPPVRVDVRSDATGRTLASGRLQEGYPELGNKGEHVVEVGRVQTDEPLRVCLANDGRRPVAVVGQVGVASPPTSGTLNGKPIGSDLALNLRSDDRSLLAGLPDIAKRAAVFRAGWVSPILYLLLAIAILVGAPLLVIRALRRAAAADTR